MGSLSRAHGVASDEPQGAFYEIDIAQTGFFDATGDNTGGGVSPKTQADYTTRATTLVLSQRSSRAQLRYKRMIANLSERVKDFPLLFNDSKIWIEAFASMIGTSINQHLCSKAVKNFIKSSTPIIASWRMKFWLRKFEIVFLASIKLLAVGDPSDASFLALSSNSFTFLL